MKKKLFRLLTVQSTILRTGTRNTILCTSVKTRFYVYDMQNSICRTRCAKHETLRTCAQNKTLRTCAQNTTLRTCAQNTTLRTCAQNTILRTRLLRIQCVKHNLRTRVKNTILRTRRTKYDFTCSICKPVFCALDAENTIWRTCVQNTILRTQCVKRNFAHSKVSFSVLLSVKNILRDSIEK